MDYKQVLEALKKLQPQKDESDIYGNIGVLLKWQKDVLPLLVFSMPLYKKFEEHSRYALDIRQDLNIFRDNDKIRKSHTDAMVKIYDDAISQLEILIKRQIIKNRFPLLYPLICEWRPLLQVPVATVTIVATFFISKHFSVSSPPQSKRRLNPRPQDGALKGTPQGC